MNRLLRVIATGLLVIAIAPAARRPKRPTVSEWLENVQARVTWDRTVVDLVLRASAFASANEMRAFLHSGLAALDNMRQNDEKYLAYIQGSPVDTYLPPQVTEAPIAPEGKAYVLMVFEKDGIYTSASATEDRAFQDLATYVRGKWYGKFPIVPPATDEKMVEQYFDNHGDDEAYEILEQDILR